MWDNPARCVGDDRDTTPNTEYETEAALLGSILCDNGVLDDLAQDSTDLFFYQDHRACFESMRYLRAAARPVDLLLLKHELVARAKWANLGGPDGPACFISHLREAVPCAANWRYYAERLRSLLAKRQLAEALAGIGGSLADPMTTGREALAQAEAKLRDLVIPEESAPATVDEVILQSAKERQERIEGNDMRVVPTGLDALNDVIRGIPVGGLTILAARPSMGKTSLAVKIAEHAAVDLRVPTAFFSMEVRPIDLVDHLLCARVNVSMLDYHAVPMKCTEYELASIMESIEQVNGAPLRVEDLPNLTPARVRSRVRLMQKDIPIRFVIVDFIQLMRPDGKHENRQHEVASISRALKVMALELDVAMLALAQLNRGPETRGDDDRKPRLSDLRDSGALEQDADVVIQIYRKGYYHPKDEQGRKDDGVTWLNVAKQRHGPTGECSVQFVDRIAWFNDIPKRSQ